MAIKPEIRSVIYQNPFGSIPKDFTSGVTIVLKNDNSIVAASLVQGGEEVASSNPQKAQVVHMKIDSPLAENGSYIVRVQTLATLGSTPNWGPTSTISVPLIPSILEINEGDIQISATTLTATFNWANNFPISAYIQMFEAGTGKLPIFKSCLQNSITVTRPYDVASLPYEIVLRPLIPLTTPTVWPPSALPTATSFCAGSGITYTLPTTSPTISSVNYHGGILTVDWAWTPPTTLSKEVEVSYELLFYINDYSYQYPAASDGITISLPQIDSQLDGYAVSCRVIFGVIKGPISDKVPVIVGNVDNVIQTTDPATKESTITWDNNSGFTDSETYNAKFTNNSPAEASNLTSASTKATLTPNKNNTVSVNVSGTSGTATTAGPYSKPFQLGTSKPQKPTAEFDGTYLSVSWTPVIGRIVKYTISVLNNDHLITPVDIPAGATSFKYKPSKAITSGASLVLQATLEGEIGPGLPSDSADINFTPAYFLSPSFPYIYPISQLSNFPLPAEGTDLKLYLPPGDYCLPGKTFSPVSQPPFALAENPKASSAQHPYPYILTIAKSTWTFTDDGVRATIQSNYISFLEAAESTGYLNAWGISVLQEAIARHMPQNFKESLYYNYGLNLTTAVIPPSAIPNVPHADLRPGMVLRVIPSDYIVVPGSDRGPDVINYLNGYTNGSPIDYDIGSYNNGTNWQVGFDAFISQLVESGLVVNPQPTALSPSVGGVADVADLYSPGFKNPFYRLFFPTDLLNPTGSGATQPNKQFNLVSADGFKTLQETTNDPTGNTNTYFRGRSIIKLCIRVQVNGNELIVPIGTTVAHILERAGRVSPKSGIKLDGLELARGIGQSSPSNSTSCKASRSYQVRFDYSNLPSYSGGESALDLPLLPGDVITF